MEELRLPEQALIANRVASLIGFRHLDENKAEQAVLADIEALMYEETQPECARFRDSKPYLNDCDDDFLTFGCERQCTVTTFHFSQGDDCEIHFNTHKFRDPTTVSQQFIKCTWNWEIGEITTFDFYLKDETAEAERLRHELLEMFDLMLDSHKFLRESFMRASSGLKEFTEIYTAWMQAEARKREHRRMNDIINFDLLVGDYRGGPNYSGDWE